MKRYILPLLSMLLLFGCASIETPFQVIITEFSDGSTVEEIIYAGAGNATVEYNMSRYLWAYYYDAAPGWPDNVTVISVEFDLCGYQNLASYPSNIMVRYPQFSNVGTMLHAGQLNGCVHITNDGNLLDSLLSTSSNPLEAYERDYVDKLEMRYPRVHNTAEEVEFVLWDNGIDIAGINYTCFAGDTARQVTGDALFERNTTYSVPSVFNFTCPAYGTEGIYTIIVSRVATFDGANYTWSNTPGYYTEVLIADGGNDERFPLKMNISSDTAGRLEIKNITIRYNNRLSYDGSEPTSTMTTSTPPWASSYSVITNSVLEAETDVGDNSTINNCFVAGTIVDRTNCTDSVIYWSDLDIAEVEDSAIFYTEGTDLHAYDSIIVNGDMTPYAYFYNVYIDSGILYDGLLDYNFTSRGMPVSGVLPLAATYGCNGSGATWSFDGIDRLLILDITWQMYDDCQVEIYDSVFGFGGNANMPGQQNILLNDNTLFVLINTTGPIVLNDATFDMDDTSALTAYNSTIVLGNTLTLLGTPRFMVYENGQLVFSGLDDVYPEVWIVQNDSDSAVYLRDINFSDYGPTYTITSDYVLGNGFVSFDDAAMPQLNNSNATVVLYDIRGFSGEIYYYENYTNDINEIVANGVLCTAPRCTNVQENFRTVSFDVTGLSSYAVTMSPVISDGDGGGSSEKPLTVSVEEDCMEDIVDITVEYSGNGVEDIEVKLQKYNPYGGFLETAHTDNDGEAELTMQGDGTYRIYFEKDGYSYDNPYVLLYESCAEEEEPELPVIEEPEPEAEEITGEPTEEEPEQAEEETIEEPIVEDIQEEVKEGEIPESDEEGYAEEETIEEEPEKDECPNFLGICWYWWLFIMFIISIAGYFIARRKLFGR